MNEDERPRFSRPPSVWHGARFDVRWPRPRTTFAAIAAAARPARDFNPGNRPAHGSRLYRHRWALTAAGVGGDGVRRLSVSSVLTAASGCGVGRGVGLDEAKRERLRSSERMR